MPIKLNTKITGDSKSANIREFRISSNAGRVSYRGNLLLGQVMPVPEGELSISNVRYFDGYSINGNILFERQSPRSFTAALDRFSINSLVLSNGLASVSLSRKGADFLWQNDFNMDRTSRLNAGGTLDLDRKNGAVLKVSSENIPGSILGLAVPALSENSFLNESFLNLAVELRTNFQGLSYTVPQFEFYNAQRNFALLASATGTGREIALRNVSLVYGDFSTSANADIQYGRENIVFSSSLSLLNNVYFLKGTYSESSGLDIEGSNRLRISWRPGNERNFFSLTSERLPLCLSERGNSFVSANLSGWYSAKEGFLIRSMNTRITGLPLPVDQNELSVSGIVDEKRAILTNIAFSDRFSTVKGVGGFYLDLAHKKINKTYLFLKDAQSGEQYEVNMDLDLPADSIDSRIYFRKTPFDRLGIVPVSGNSTGRLLVSGKISDPHLSLTLKEFDANYSVKGFETNAAGSADLADLLKNPETDILLERIKSSISLEDFSASLLASARLQNLQRDPDLDLDISNFQASFTPSYMSGNFLGNASLKTHLKESEQQELVAILKDGIKMQALRNFLSEAVQNNSKFNTELKAVLSLKDAEIHTDNLTGKVSAEAGLFSDISRTDVGLHLYLEKAATELKDLAISMNASFDAGSSLSGSDLVTIFDLIQDGKKFRDILAVYASDDFSDFREQFFGNVHAENVSIAYGKDTMDLKIDGNIDAALAKGLLSLSAQGMDLQLTTSPNDNHAYVFPAKLDISGQYDAEELREMSDFLETVESLEMIQTALHEKQLPAGFWKTYFSILVDEGMIALSDKESEVLASVSANISGTLDEVNIAVRPEFDGEINTPDKLFHSDLKGSAVLKGSVDNRMISEILGILAGKMSIKEINTLLSWIRDPDIVVQLILDKGKIENKNILLPVTVKADLTSDLNFISGDINAEISEGQIRTGTFSALVSSTVKSAVHGKFVNFNAVLKYLDSAKSANDTYTLVETLFQNAETTTHFYASIKEGNYKTANMEFPVSAEINLDSEINTPQMREIVYLSNNKPDFGKILRQVSGLSDKASVQDAVRKIAVSIIDNNFDLIQLEAAFSDYPDLASVLSSRIDAGIKVNKGRIILPWLDASVDVEAFFSGQLNDPQSRIQIRFSDARVKLDQFEGVVNAAVAFRGSLSNPEIAIDFGETYGKLLGRDFSSEGRLVSYGNTLYFEDYSVRFDFLKLKQMNGFWDLNKGNSTLDGYLGGGFTGFPLSGNVHLDLETAKNLKMSQINTFVDKPLELSVSASNIRLGENYRDNFSFRLVSDENGLSVTSNDEYVFDFKYRDDNELFLNYKRNDTIVFVEAGNNQDLYEASLSVENFSLGFLDILSHSKNGKLFSILSRYKLDTSALFRKGLDKYSFAVPNFSLAEGENSVFRIQASGNDDQITVNSLQFRNYLDNVYGTGSIRFDSKGFHLASQLSFNSENYRLKAEGMLDDFIFYGSHGLTGHAGISEDKMFYSILINDLVLPFRGRNPMKVSLRSSARYQDRDNWKVDALSMILQDIPLLGQNNFLQIEGKADSGKGGDVSLTYKDFYSELNGKITADIQNEAIMISGKINSSAEDEKYLIDARVSGDDILGIISVSQFPLKRIPGFAVGGFIGGELLINANNTGSIYDFSLKLSESEILGKRFAGSLRGIYSGNTLKISEGSLTVLNFQISDMNAQFDLDKSRFTMDTDWKTTGNMNNAFSGKINVAADFESDFRSPPLSDLIYSDFTGKLGLENFAVNEKIQQDWDFTFARSENSYTVNGGPGDGISASFDNKGMFRFDLDEKLPVSLHAEGTVHEDELEANIADIDVDLSYFRYFLEIPFINFHGGTAKGDLRIAGSLKDPDFYGEFDGDKVLVQTDFVPEELGPLQTIVTLNEKEMRIPFRIESGEFNNIEFLGLFEFERWIPSFYNLSFNTIDKEGVHIHFPVEKLETDGYVSGSFNVEGDTEGAKMTGDLTVFNCVITELDQTVREKRDDLFDTIIDLKLKTGRNVSINWPKNPTILEATARIGQNISIFLDSGRNEFALKGNINIQSGTILWFQRNFYIKNGKLVFNEKGDYFDPKITAKAELLEVSSRSERVRIYLELENDSINNLTPTFSSQPYLSNSEIASILGNSTFRNQDDEITLASTTMTITDIVSQLTIIRGFEKRIQNLLNLDLFSIRTQMIQNVLLSKVFNEEGDLINVDPLSRYLDNTTLFFGKQLTNALYFEALVILNANDYNAAVGSFNALNIESELSLEWNTPLFLLDFSLRPDIYSLIDSLDSINMGFSWGFQF
ncbi:MAG: hypothetical protein JW874_13290 [Spirochaetales bacterium]|nr:hypothetical protein [Spirochaetales bacterium]